MEKFLGVLTENRSLLPELLVEPEGLESEPRKTKRSGPETEDPLLDLFYGETLSTESFHDALRQQRATPQSQAAHA